MLAAMETTPLRDLVLELENLLMKVYDEHHEAWEVTKGDPGWRAATYLKSIGFIDIILPLAILVYGTRRDDLLWPTVERLRSIVDDTKFLFYSSLFEQADALDSSGEFCYHVEEEPS